MIFKGDQIPSGGDEIVMQYRSFLSWEYRQDPIVPLPYYLGKQGKVIEALLFRCGCISLQIIILEPCVPRLLHR